MKWLSKNKINIILIYLNILFDLGVMKKAYRMENYSFFTIALLISLGVLIYWVCHSILYRSDQKIIFFLIISAMILGGIILFRNGISEFFYNGIVKSIERINSNLYGNKNTNFNDFKNIFILAIPLITIAVLWLSERGLLDAIILLDFSILMFLWMLDYVNEVKGSLFKFSILSIITYAINNHNVFMKKINSLRIKQNIKPIRVIVPITVTATILSLLISFMPQGVEGKYTKIIVDKFNNSFSPSIGGEGAGKIKSNLYSLSQSGYSDTERKLGGALTINNALVLKVDSNKPYYLKGSVKEIYNGSSWKTNKKQFDNKNEFMYAKTQVISEGRIPENAIKVYPENKNNSTIFMPNYPLKIEIDKGDIYINEESSIAAFAGLMNSSYQVSFLEEDYFINRVIYNKKNVMNMRENAEDKMEYLQLPDSISIRTVELVDKIVAGSKNNYDKAERIRKYISDNYQYSLNVSEVPSGKDFVDYYLFEEKKGYCVYSASAFTIMLRIAGIPARYVEGFKMPPEKSSQGLYQVTNEDAHAWTEAYLDDGYNSYWITMDTSTTPTEQRIRNERTNNTTPEEDKNLPLPQQNKPEEKLQEVKTEEVTPTNSSNKVPKSIYVLLGAITIIVLKTLLNKSNHKKIVNSKSMIPIYKYSLRRIKSLGYNKPSSQTDKEFINTIQEEDLKKQMSHLVDLVYEEYYGGKEMEISKDILWRKIEKAIKKSSKNKFIYFIRRYLF